MLTFNLISTVYTICVWLQYEPCVHVRMLVRVHMLVHVRMLVHVSS